MRAAVLDAEPLIRRDLDIEMSPWVAEPLYLGPLGERPFILMNDGPAIGYNAEWQRGRRSAYNVSLQRVGEDVIRAGLARGDAMQVREGVEIFDWGRNRQAADGSFPGNAHGVHGVAFFLQGLAHALALLAIHPLGAGHHAASCRFESSLVQAADHLCTPRRYAQGRRDDAVYTHQQWLLACALGLIATLTGERRWDSYERDLVERGLAGQHPDGYFTERGGPDTAYSALSIVFAQRWLIYRGGGLRDRVSAAVDRAIDWQRLQIDDDGRIDPGRNVRTNGQEADAQGRKKGPGYLVTLRALAVWGLVGQREDLLQASQKLATHIAEASTTLSPPGHDQQPLVRYPSPPNPQPKSRSGEGGIRTREGV